MKLRMTETVLHFSLDFHLTVKFQPRPSGASYPVFHVSAVERLVVVIDKVLRFKERRGSLLKG